MQCAHIEGCGLVDDLDPSQKVFFILIIDFGVLFSIFEHFELLCSDKIILVKKLIDSILF